MTMSRPAARAAELRVWSHVARRMSSPSRCTAHARWTASSPRRACGEIAGVAGEWFVDRDDAQLGVEILEHGDCADVGRLVDAARASSRCERCACLGVDELARDNEVGAIP